MSLIHFGWPKKVLLFILVVIFYFVYLKRVILQLQINPPTKNTVILDVCQWNRSDQVLGGKVHVNKTVPSSFEEIESLLNVVQSGGRWKPRDCEPKHKVAIVIPYKNREENLKVFLRHFHPILISQLLKYRIFIIEQDDDSPFNRAKLMNVGFAECLKYDTFSSIVFHDVDLIAENKNNYYACAEKPRHLCPAVDKFSYQLFSDRLFGGAVCFSRDDFLTINGFSNKYWGWGSEDDDMYWRMHHAKMSFARPAMNIGRYSMLGHKQQERNGIAMTRLIKMERGELNASHDGISTLTYNAKERFNKRLFTHIKVDLLMTQSEKDLTTVKKGSV